MNAMRDYRRALALFVLASSSTPMTANDVADAMIATAAAEDHPQACRQGVDALAALGFLRALENAGQVEQTGESKAVGRGRHAPYWRSSIEPAARAALRVPFPPEESPAPAPAPASPYADMTRQQLLTVLEVHDLYGAATAQFLQHMADLNRRARRMLAEAGLGPEAA